MQKTWIHTFNKKIILIHFLFRLLKLETNPENMKSSSSSTEFLMYLSTFIENQFKGRMMLLPPFSYTQSMDLTIMAETLSKDIKSNGI